MQTPCEIYAEVISNCYYGGAYQAQLLIYCEDYTAYLGMTYGAVCVGAFEDLLVCLDGLSCMELPNLGNPGVCDVELAAFNGACV